MCSTSVVAGCTDKSPIAQTFAYKYRSLYTCVHFDDAEMRDILVDLEDPMLDGGLSKSDHIITSADVTTAIERLNQYKNGRQ